MEQRDYIKRQIDQLARVLGTIFSDLFGLKGKGQINDGIAATNQAFKGELDLDLEELCAIRSDNFINTLKTEKNFSNGNLDKLADILLLVADNGQDKNNKMLYEKCFTIYEYLTKVENVYSLDRQWKIERIKNMI
jgi:hypothetical protein